MRRVIPALLLFTAFSARADAPYVPDKKAAAAYAKATAAAADGQTDAALADAAAIATGKALYGERCAVCHGPTGKGDGPASVALDPRPADFSDASRWAGSSPGIKHWIVLNGIAGTGMASSGLDTQQAWDVLAYIGAAFAPR